MLASHILLKCKLVSSECSLGLGGGLGSLSVSVLLSSVHVSQVSKSTSARGVSSDGLHGPGVSSLGCTSSGGGSLSLLEMEVGLATHSTDGVRVGVLLTSCWGSPGLSKCQRACVYLPFQI